MSSLQFNVIHYLIAIAFAFPSVQTTRKADSVPWAAEVRCNLNPARPAGLHPDAFAALQRIGVAHRITQGFNASSDRGNVHFADGTIAGKPYTGAADISVRCLTAAQIKLLLGRLADQGFAAW